MGTVIQMFPKKFVVRPERVELPDDIQASMDNWRLAGSWCPPPETYVEFHRQLATKELQRITAVYGVQIMVEQMNVAPGLNDMQVLEAHVATPSGLIRVITWDDTFQGFMQKLPGGGLGILMERDLR